MRMLLNQRYQLTEPVGSGGMSVVWRAIDTRLGRDVAVKIPHAGLSTDVGFRRRFEAEAKAAAGLQASGIAAVFDYGHDTGDDGTVTTYIVMEYVPGGALSRRLAERGRLGPEETARLIAEAADALHEAHQADIVHRDVKPGNILLRAKDDAVKIVDFGIALALGAAETTNSILGTASYASPEQITGDTVTAVSDVYSLGIVAYECLAGRRPFCDDSDDTAMEGHLYRPPPPLPDDVPAALAEVVAKALGKDPSTRWPGAAQFATALRATGYGNVRAAGVDRDPDPTPVTGPTTLVTAHDERTVVVGRRRRRRLTVLAAVTATVIVGAAAVWATGTPTSTASLVPGVEPTTEAPSQSPTPSPIRSGGSPSPEETTTETPEEPPVAMSSVPWVMGLTEAEARAELAAAGFTGVSVEYWDGSGDHACVVDGQTPWPFQEMPTDTPIVLDVQMTVSADACNPFG